jgi:hypothetical protein
MADMEKIADSVFAAVKGYVASMLKPLSDRTTELERKLSEAHSKGFRIQYVGVYRDGKSYEAGQFATHQGGLWHCNEDTDMRPGSGPHWTLAVKSGEAR